MSVQAKLRYSRMSPRKVRLVADLVRNKQVTEAEKILEFTINRPAKPILKLLRSAIANAEHNHSLKKEDLYVAEIKVDGGPIIKRFRPRARGAAFPIHKRTSHISIKLSKKEGGKESAEKKKKKAKIEKVYQTEKPKEEASMRSSRSRHIEDESAKKESAKDVKGDKKQVFRRKSI